MRALVLGASVLVAALGAAAPVAQAQVILPPGVAVPPPAPIGTPPYGYLPSPYGLYGMVPPYGSTGQPSSVVCTDPQSGQQLIIPSANVFPAIASTCVPSGPGQ
ncbi:MAG TPA: hypothetical protein VK066_25370 [Chloroflexota bacterium]|nr:hypothetical protein [Chloroflexota bacterium]